MDEDPTDDVARVLITMSAGASRAFEVALRAAREQKARQVAQLERDNQAAIQRLSSQAASAERHFAVVDAEWMNAASATDASQAWSAGQQWAQLDPQRLGPHAERINAAASDITGIDLAASVSNGTVTIEEATSTLHSALSDRGTAAEEPSAAVDAAAAAGGVERNAANAREAVASDVHSATSRRDQLVAAGVPPQAIEARLMADKLTGRGNQVAAQSTATAEPPISQRERQSAAQRAPAQVGAPRPGTGRTSGSGVEV